MKHTREELNNKLLLELEYSQAKGEANQDLKLLYFELANRISKNKKKYPFLNEDLRVLCVAQAYYACILHAIKFNRKRSEDAYSYISIIIRSSFAGTIKRQSDKKRKQPLFTRITRKDCIYTNDNCGSSTFLC